MLPTSTQEYSGVHDLRCIRVGYDLSLITFNPVKLLINVHNRIPWPNEKGEQPDELYQVLAAAIWPHLTWNFLFGLFRARVSMNTKAQVINHIIDVNNVGKTNPKIALMHTIPRSFASYFTYSYSYIILVPAVCFVDNHVYHCWKNGQIKKGATVYKTISLWKNIP